MTLKKFKIKEMLNPSTYTLNGLTNPLILSVFAEGSEAIKNSFFTNETHPSTLWVGGGIGNEGIIIIQPMQTVQTMQTKVNCSDIFGVFKDLLNMYQEFLLTLNLGQQIAITNLCADIFIFACLVTIVTIFYGDLVIKYFNLEERFPKLAKLIQLRRKFKTYSFSLNIALIFAILICVVLFNLYFIFYMSK